MATNKKMEITTSSEELEFLIQSNAIENVHDNVSLRNAIEAWEYLLTFDKMNPQLVKQVHKILMRDSDLEREYIGKYRKCAVQIGGRLGMDWKELPEAMSEWCKQMNIAYPKDSLGARESMMKVMHVRYEKIHPFADGNGRTGRMFMNWQRLKLLDLPLLTIHVGKEQQNYYSWFTEKII